MERIRIKEELFYIGRNILSLASLLAAAMLLAGVLRQPLLERENAMFAQPDTEQSAGAGVPTDVIVGTSQEGQTTMTQTQTSVIVPPDAVLELLGMKGLQQVDAGYEVFFLLLLFLNVYVCGSVIAHSIRIMQWDVHGAYLYYYGQTMSRTGYFIRRTAMACVSALFVWGIYVAECLITVRILSERIHVEASAITSILMRMGQYGIIVVLLMAALGILYEECSSHRYTGGMFALNLLTFSVLLGNLYKVTQLIEYSQLQAQRDGEIFERLTEVIRHILVICPTAWLNPFTIQQEALPVNTLYGFGGVTLLLLVISGAVWLRRDYE